jgi:hypothetical protein
MHEELENFERTQVWTLVEPPCDVNVIGTKWVFKNKQGEDGEVVRKRLALLLKVLVRWKVYTLGKHLLLLLILRPLGFS